MIPCPRPDSGETTVHYLKRAVVTVVATGALAAIAVPAWADAGPGATPSAAPSPVTGLPSDATKPSPVTSLPPGATSSAAPTPVTSVPPSGASSAAQSELAQTGSSTTTAAMGAGAAGLVVLGAGALFIVRRRALR